VRPIGVGDHWQSCDVHSALLLTPRPARIRYDKVHLVGRGVQSRFHDHRVVTSCPVKWAVLQRKQNSRGPSVPTRYTSAFLSGKKRPYPGDGPRVPQAERSSLINRSNDRMVGAVRRRRAESRRARVRAVGENRGGFCSSATRDKEFYASFDPFGRHFEHASADVCGPFGPDSSL